MLNEGAGTIKVLIADDHQYDDEQNYSASREAGALGFVSKSLSLKKVREISFLKQ